MVTLHTNKDGLLQSQELYQYLLESSALPRESELLKEIRDRSASHPMAIIAATPDAGQFIAMILSLTNARKTIEVGVFTGYSLLLTALTIPPDGKIVAIDVDRKTYEIGLPVLKKAGIEHKINFIESPGLLALDNLLEDNENKGSFDFAFVDADKDNYPNYHDKLMKLVRVGGVIIYDNTLWGGAVALPEDPGHPKRWREIRLVLIEFTRMLVADTRIQISHVPVGDGLIVCKRLE